MQGIRETYPSQTPQTLCEEWECCFAALLHCCIKHFDLMHEMMR